MTKEYAEYNSDADVEVEDCLDSKVGIPLITNEIVAEGVSLENIKCENLDGQLSEDVTNTEDYKKYNSDIDIKVEDNVVQTGDFLDSKAGIPLISTAIIVKDVSLESIKRENLNDQLSKHVGLTENCKICSSNSDIKVEDFIVEMGDFLALKTGTVTQGVSLENKEIGNLNDGCDNSFNDKQKLHEVSCKSDKIVGCTLCGKLFKGKNNVYHHIRREHFTSKGYTCNYCGGTFLRCRDLINHMETHSRHMKTCKICNKLYCWNTGLRAHMKTHTGEKHFSCEICKKSFTEKFKLMDHIKTHTRDKPFTCKICNKSYYWRAGLTAHMKIHADEYPFTCEVCKKSYSQKSVLNNHMRKHTKPFTCEVCKKSFSYKNTLISHIKAHTGDKPFTCKICNKSYCSKEALKNHIRTHTGEKPFTCEICKKSYIHKSGLASHIKTHAGEKPFTCEICKKSFYWKGTLARHTKTCTGENSDL